MYVPLQEEGEDEDGVEDGFLNENCNVSTPIPRPPSLQWVSVGKGGRVSSVRTVRSHVSKEYQQRQRERKNASLGRLIKQQHAPLRPSRDRDVIAGSSQGQDTDPGIGTSK